MKFNVIAVATLAAIVVLVAKGCEWVNVDTVPGCRHVRRTAQLVAAATLGGRVVSTTGFKWRTVRVFRRFGSFWPRASCNRSTTSRLTPRSMS